MEQGGVGLGSRVEIAGEVVQLGEGPTADRVSGVRGGRRRFGARAAGRR